MNMRPKLPIAKANKALSPALVRTLRDALVRKYQKSLNSSSFSLELKSGNACAWLMCKVGDISQHCFELFVADVPGDEIEGALGVIIDFLDGVLDEFFAADRDAYLSLDYSLYKFGEYDVYGRSTLVQPALESDADALLRSAGFDPKDVS